jgi:predicted O-methyltransferase YrrM
MLEQIKDPRRHAISQANNHALDLLRRVLDVNPQPIIAEIGVGVGATTIELCRLLNHRGDLYLFDFVDRVTALGDDLRREGFSNIRLIGNERKTFASYAWELAKLLSLRRAAGVEWIFDFVFLDGGHYFHHDAPAAIVLKDLLKPGGYILFDDYDWSIAISPTTNPAKNAKVLDDFSQEQIDMSHVKFVCDLFFDTDPNFHKIDLGYGEHEHRRAYRKRGDS